MFSSLIDIIFNEHPTVAELFALAGCLAIFWSVFFATTVPLITQRVMGKKWFTDSLERDYEREGKKLCETIGIPMTMEEFVDMKARMWPRLQLISVQHLLGGLLCLPSVFGLAAPKTSSALACLSIISEMGWEMEDVVYSLWTRFFTKDGKKAVPDIMLLLIPMHHSLTSLLAIPTIMRYRNLRILHLLCFDLQAASAVALIVGEYTKLLDVSKPNHLRQFQALTFVGLLMSMWARGIHWVYILFQFTQVWINDEAWIFLSIGVPVGLFFSLFNWFFCIGPFYKRFRKFMRVSREYTSLSATASPSHRRSSMIALESAAAELNSTITNDVAADASALFTERKISRRVTMPSKLFQRARRLSAVAMLQFSMGSKIPDSQLQELEGMEKKST